MTGIRRQPGGQQQLALDTGRDGRRCAKLSCTEFSGDGPDYHAMICQVGKVSVRQGQWYRLTFWAKGEGIKGGAVEVALDQHAAVGRTPGWQKLSRPAHSGNSLTSCSAPRQDLPAAASRLQFWFKSTGTLWLDDVALAESAVGQQWFPQISTDGVKNFVPNSSFECGAANWGSFTYGLSGWAGNLYRLEGEVDGSRRPAWPAQPARSRSRPDAAGLLLRLLRARPRSPSAACWPPTAAGSASSPARS